MTRIPTDLREFLDSTFGIVTEKELLSGIAGDGALRLKFQSGNSVIIKSSTSPQERNFYELHADRIRRAGVGVPDLYWYGSDHTGMHWIVTEDIPSPFPKERWICDPQQIEMLFRLHFGTWREKMPTLDGEAYQPVWNDEMTSQACDWFDATMQNQVENQLTILQMEAQVLFGPICCLSADPNPTNWRIRSNGELVLIDWERFSYGHPVIDLAITMPGVGSKDGTLERRITELYRECWETHTGGIPVELDNLDRLIRVAKLWSVVEFLANARLKPEMYRKETVTYIVRELPSFFDSLAGGW